MSKQQKKRQLWILDEAGEPFEVTGIEYEKWLDWHQADTRRQIAYTRETSGQVSTVFLGHLAGQNPSPYALPTPIPLPKGGVYLMGGIPHLTAEAKQAIAKAEAGTKAAVQAEPEAEEPPETLLELWESKATLGALTGTTQRYTSREAAVIGHRELWAKVVAVAGGSRPAKGTFPFRFAGGIQA